ncbi:kinase-like domain-containing protein [Rhizoctonia solani]|nr:kinase-like domain-containing protein [Rhizoctonia solani]
MNGSMHSDGTGSAISGAMSTSEILTRLVQHDCKDITNQIDTPNSGRTAVSTGGSGDIYLGSLLNGSQVGIKCLRILLGADEQGRKLAKQAARELYVWSKCKHPNILELLGVAQYEGRVAMVSPWMKYGNLSWYLSQHPEADRDHLCVQVADAVAYLKYRNVVHGDIKGANFVVSDNHIPQLTDFGSSAISQCSLRFTTTEDVSKFTVRWTAPEILIGETKHTFEGDVYALGMTILEIITGSVPWDGMIDVAIVANLIQKRHPTRPVTNLPIGDRISDLLWELMMKCWASDPVQRPPATEVRDELDAIRGQRTLPYSDRVGLDMSPILDPDRSPTPQTKSYSHRSQDAGPTLLINAYLPALGGSVPVYEAPRIVDDRCTLCGSQIQGDKSRPGEFSHIHAVEVGASTSRAPNLEVSPVILNNSNSPALHSDSPENISRPQQTANRLPTIRMDVPPNLDASAQGIKQFVEQFRQKMNKTDRLVKCSLCALAGRPGLHNSKPSNLVRHLLAHFAVRQHLSFRVSSLLQEIHNQGSMDNACDKVSFDDPPGSDHDVTAAFCA